MEELTRRVNVLETDMATVKANNEHMTGSLSKIEVNMDKAQERVETLSRTMYKIAGGLAVVAAIAPFVAKFVLG